MPWDLSGHGLLSPEAAALPGLPEHTALAADLLGLDDASFEAGSEERARAERALSLQVSHQVQQGPAAHVLSSSSRGGRSESYRDVPVDLHPVAVQLARDLTGNEPPGGLGWSALRSYRG